MVKIKVNYIKDNIDEIMITGHSGYDVSGKDIVCASVSSIVITTINAILNFDKTINFIEDYGLIKIKVIKNDKITKTLLLNMINMFNELEKKYNKYIKII